MLKTVNDVVSRIVQYYKPEKVILYGSYDTENRKNGSDVDLLIVKDTDRRLFERLVEVERLLSDRTLPYMRKATGSWIKEAKDELDSAIILFEHGKYRGACYHSQQSVEKGLKALILEKGEKPGKVHDIVELLSHAKRLGWQITLAMDDAVFLNSIYKG